MANWNGAVWHAKQQKNIAGDSRKVHTKKITENINDHGDVDREILQKKKKRIAEQNIALLVVTNHSPCKNPPAIYFGLYLWCTPHTDCESDNKHTLESCSDFSSIIIDKWLCRNKLNERKFAHSKPMCVLISTWTPPEKSALTESEEQDCSRIEIVS